MPLLRVRGRVRLLVGFDGSPPSRRALEHAIRRAAAAKDDLVVLTVIPPTLRDSSFQRMMPAGVELPPQMSGTFVETARKRLDEVVAEAVARGVQAKGEVRADEDAARALLAAVAELGADEVLIGHKSYEGPEFTLGANADAVVRGADVPVTVVR